MMDDAAGVSEVVDENEITEEDASEENGEEGRKNFNEDLLNIKP